MAVTIGAGRVTIYIESSNSLKDKRHVIRSVVTRARQKFNAAIAEVEDLNDLRVATVAIVVVSNDAGHVERMLAEIVRFIERTMSDGVVGEIETELIPI